ncbi:MAG TPA: sigma-70 family RNA polymerase sigma factor [Trebonia sp.]|nr:sigma-70 family RNA polymerase sigma factor [Trebonia sp.]
MIRRGLGHAGYMGGKLIGSTELEFGVPRPRLGAADGEGPQQQASAPLDDATLVVRAREGDVYAFEDLVRRYKVPVYRIAVRILNDPSSAADTAQDAFVTAWRRLPEIKAEQAFAAWLYRIAVTRAVSTLRTVRPHVPFDETAAARDQLPGPEEHALADGLAAALRCALNRLTPEQRACWILREMEGLSYEEVAAILHTTPGAVRGRLHRARLQLAEELTPWR